MKKIQQVSKGMAAVLSLALITIVLILAGLAVYPNLSIAHLYNTYNFSPDIPPLSAWQYVALAIAAIFSALPLLFALWKLRKMFQLFAAGEVFSALATRHLFNAAKGMVIWGVITVFSATVVVLILTANAPAGEHMLVINVSSAELASIFIGVVFAIMSWVMQEAARLSDENARFV